MFKADELETQADAAGALRVVEGMPLDSRGKVFWRPERTRRLRQLVLLGDAAPAWVWARWVVAQAAQSTPGDVHRAMDLAVETRGGPSTLWGVDEIDARAKVIDHDWVYRQLALHEYGGLATFVRRRASRMLLSRAQGIATWAGAPMGAYELVEESASHLTWRDVDADRLLTTLNLGGAVFCAPGAHVIGRVVASGGKSLFESAPLAVPPDVAEAVAASPTDWVDALAQGCDDYGPTLSLLVARLHRFDLLADAPSHVRNGRHSDLSLVLAAVAGDLDLEDTDVPAAPIVAAALLEPGTVEALDGLLVPSDAAALTWLGGVLAEPAGVVCQRLVAELSSAA
ncbi:hypothetical protein NSZ01_13890 [Nocardioides szechwanensis]|uniref:Uncharacterized protein n=2 Tax=Nocardioides szechwanensis TaxID=1005944 RepID=A0A1H0BTM2_9ACTN|nr:hypothetical protein NSZ01_13890 [Nocardioides szechwanensis]SDN48923.1 hypothetical protein SAMN05192576_2227 [Nocardioides szechwanensis]